jgi:Helix-turn-helix domain
MTTSGGSKSDKSSPDDLAGMFTPAELAAILKVSVGTLQNWRVKGVGPPYIKLGLENSAPVRYLETDVRRWQDALVRIVPLVQAEADARRPLGQRRNRGELL